MLNNALNVEFSWTSEGKVSFGQRIIILNMDEGWIVRVRMFGNDDLAGLLHLWRGDSAIRQRYSGHVGGHTLFLNMAALISRAAHLQATATQL